MQVLFYFCFGMENLKAIDFLSLLTITVQPLMLNDGVQNMSKLQSTSAKAECYLSKLVPDTSYSKFEYVYAYLDNAFSCHQFATLMMLEFLWSLGV